MSKDLTKSIFELLNKNDHEQLVYCCDKEIGLKAIIGIHNTACLLYTSDAADE